MADEATGLGGGIKKGWAWWQKWPANIFTFWGLILPVFFGIFFYRAHEANPDADFWDGMWGFYEAIPEEGAANIAVGMGYFALDSLSLAWTLAADFVFPGISIAFNAIAGAMATETAIEVAATTAMDAVAPAVMLA